MVNQTASNIYEKTLTIVVLMLLQRICCTEKNVFSYTEAEVNILTFTDFILLPNIRSISSE